MLWPWVGSGGVLPWGGSSSPHREPAPHLGRERSGGMGRTSRVSAALRHVATIAPIRREGKLIEDTLCVFERRSSLSMLSMGPHPPPSDGPNTSAGDRLPSVGQVIRSGGLPTHVIDPFFIPIGRGTQTQQCTSHILGLVASLVLRSSASFWKSSRLRSTHSLIPGVGIPDDRSEQTESRQPAGLGTEGPGRT